MEDKKSNKGGNNSISIINDNNYRISNIYGYEKRCYI